MSDAPRAEIPITFNGKTLVFPRLGLHQIFELERWVRKSSFKLFVQAMEDEGASNFLQQQMKAEAWDRAHSMMLLSISGRKFMYESVETLVQVLWVSARDYAPNVSVFHDGKPGARLSYNDLLGWLPVHEVMNRSIATLQNLVVEIVGYYEPENPIEPATAGAITGT
jgi:hypothetical protein